MSKVASRRSKFAELRALRKAGKKAFDTYEVERVEDLYEVVDENQYKKIVRDRLNQDDFVVDDNGEGYADDGREDFGPAPMDDMDSDDDMPVHHRKDGKACSLPRLPARGVCITRPVYLTAFCHITAKKKAREDEQAKRDANDRDISEYFTQGAAKVQPKPKVRRPHAHVSSPVLEGSRGS